MQKIFSAQHPTEAHLVRGILESHGISCEVQGENLFSVRGEIPITEETAPTVWIHEDAQKEDAVALIRELEESKLKDDTRGPWICASCEEESEGQFTECWSCGTSRVTADS